MAVDSNRDSNEMARREPTRADPGHGSDVRAMHGQARRSCTELVNETLAEKPDGKQGCRRLLDDLDYDYQVCEVARTC